VVNPSPRLQWLSETPRPSAGGPMTTVPRPPASPARPCRPTRAGFIPAKRMPAARAQANHHEGLTILKGGHRAQFAGGVRVRSGQAPVATAIIRRARGVSVRRTRTEGWHHDSMRRSRSARQEALVKRFPRPESPPRNRPPPDWSHRAVVRQLAMPTRARPAHPPAEVPGRWPQSLQAKRKRVALARVHPHTTPPGGGVILSGGGGGGPSLVLCRAMNPQERRLACVRPCQPAADIVVVQGFRADLESHPKPARSWQPCTLRYAQGQSCC